MDTHPINYKPSSIEMGLSPNEWRVPPGEMGVHQVGMKVASNEMGGSPGEMEEPMNQRGAIPESMDAIHKTVWG